MDKRVGRIDADHVAAVLALAGGPRSQGELNLPGAWVGRRYVTLLVRRAPPPVFPQPPFTVSGPGNYPLADGRVLSVVLADRASGEGADAAEFCARQVTFPLAVRAPQPGDRLRPDGMTGSKKLHDLFIDLKLPAEARRAAALVWADGDLLWVAGLRRAAGRLPAPGSGPVLRLELFAAPAGPGGSSAQSA